ncbi:MAG: hypothetical protein AABY83_08620 [Pseudomonadota bacterium]
MPWRVRCCLLLGILLCVACARPQGEMGVACMLNAGDLSITELMVTPGADAPEWVEIYNNAAHAVVLNRAVFSFASDTASLQLWVVDDPQEIPAHAYWVLGNAPAPHVNSVVSNASTLAARNMTVSVQCRDQVLDQVYVAQRHLQHLGRAATFEGYKIPAPSANDDARDWCVARTYYNDAERGTPGSANAPCGMSMCRAATGGVREAYPPAGRAAVISEIYRDAPGADTNREWVEFYNRSDVEFDLNGLIMLVDFAEGNARYDLADDTCLTIAPHQLRVVRIVSDAQRPVPEDRVAATTIEGEALYNGESAYTLFNGDNVVAQAALDAAPTGVADGTGDPQADMPTFCPAHRTGVFGVVDAISPAVVERGSPGLPNDPCGELCRIDNGSWRLINAPRAGEWVLSEWYSDPQGSDTGYEWVELYVDSERTLDLNGLEIKNIHGVSGNALSTRIDQENCISVAPHSRAVIADAKAQFADSVNLVRVPGLQLYNAAGELIITRNALEIDRASVAAPVTGRSASLDASLTTANDNYTPSNFCNGRSLGLFQDAQGAAYGTPGFANDPCGAQWCMEDNAWRIRMPFATGALVLNEVYSHGGSVNDGADWLEVAALDKGDVSGLAISQKTTSVTRAWQVDVPQCLGLQAGQRLVIAGPKSTVGDAVKVQGLDYYVADSEYQLHIDNVLIDTANVPRQTADRALVPSAPLSDAAQNDVNTQWCVAVNATPGVANAACVP